MNIIRIIVKELKQNLRNTRSMTIMVLFPIVLTVVLGTALSGVFDNSAQFKDIKIVYTLTGHSAYAQTFRAFQDSSKKLGMQFLEVAGPEQGMAEVKGGNYVAFIRVGQKEIELNKNHRKAFQADLVEGILGTYLQRGEAISAIAKVNPGAVSAILANERVRGNVSNLTLGGRSVPGAMDYYAVTMLTLIVLYSSLSGVSSINNEKTLHTMTRMLASPASKYHILTGKVLGTLAITLIQVLVLMGFSKYALGTNWGQHPATVIGLVAAEVTMAVSLGLGLALLLKDEGTPRGLLNMLIPVVAFLGGGYVPAETFGKTMLMLSEYSPLRWINRAIFQVIYGNDFSTVGTALLFNLGIALVFIVITSLGMSKEAV